MKEKPGVVPAVLTMCAAPPPVKFADAPASVPALHPGAGAASRARPEAPEEAAL